MFSAMSRIAPEVIPKTTFKIMASCSLPAPSQEAKSSTNMKFIPKGLASYWYYFSKFLNNWHTCVIKPPTHFQNNSPAMFSGRKICGKLFHMRGKLEAPHPLPNQERQTS